LIEAQGLTKHYGSLVAVRDLTFQVSKGSVSGLLGSNGAGKTTALRMLAGVTGPTRGTVRLCGYDLIASPLQARRCLGYLPETSPLYPEMTTRQYLSYRAELKGVAHSRREALLCEAARDAGCEDILNITIGRLSRGHRQRVGLADTLQTKPPVILLDEPTAGLDPNQVRRLRELIGRLKANHAILVSTHLLAEVESLCTNVLVMHKGQLIANDSIEALRARHSSAELRLTFRDPDRRARAVLASLEWQVCDERAAADAKVNTTNSSGIAEARIRLVRSCSDPDEAIERLIAALVTAGVGVRSVEHLATGLETAFSSLSLPDESAPP
jgi:ABC-2 type transport system ATP-binding protein